MAAKFFLVTSDPYFHSPVRDGVTSAIVVAEASADAKALMESLHGDTVRWANATYTEFGAGADLAGWSLRVQVLHPTDTAGAAVTVTDVTVTGAAAATVDSIAALAVIALNAAGPMASASYNSSTNILTVAETTDGLGDQRVVASFTPPGTESKSIPGFLGAITHEGASGAALKVALAADTYTVPSLNGAFKQAA